MTTAQLHNELGRRLVALRRSERDARVRELIQDTFGHRRHMTVPVARACRRVWHGLMTGHCDRRISRCWGHAPLDEIDRLHIRREYHSEAVALLA